MKISGIYTTGPKKGQAKKMSDAELTAEVVKDEFCARNPPGYRRLVYGVTINNITVQVGRQDANEKHNDPRTLIAVGTISYKILKENSDRLRKMPRPANFLVTFKEATDELGQPDAKVLKYSEQI